MGLTISGNINRMGLLTLPDLFRRKYGALMEVLVSCIEVVSFTCLLAAAHLVGTSLLVQFSFGLPLWAGVAIPRQLVCHLHHRWRSVLHCLCGHPTGAQAGRATAAAAAHADRPDNSRPCVDGIPSIQDAAFSAEISALPGEGCLLSP